MDLKIFEKIINEAWNDKNNVKWLHKLTDVGTKRILIDKGSWQKDFSIVVTPTIIIFVNGSPPVFCIVSHLSIPVISCYPFGYLSLTALIVFFHSSIPLW